MTAMAHTPAPLDCMAVSANASGGCHLYIIDANGRKIAALWGKAEEKQANAVLWSAAPDLLAAAQKVLAGLNARIDAAPSSAKPVFDGIADLHGAINRATGLNPDDIDNCIHCGSAPEDAGTRCPTGEGRKGRPCDGEAA